jgi:hypothetical protein
MKTGLSDQIRRAAKEKYVDPAVRSGQKEFSIPVRGMLDLLLPSGFPRNHTPQICNSIQTSKFLNQNGLEILGVDGPPSGQSPTVVVRYRITGQPISVKASQLKESSVEAIKEDAAARAKRLTEALRGLLKEELKEHGGAEAFVRWIRSDDEEAA